MPKKASFLTLLRTALLALVVFALFSFFTGRAQAQQKTEDLIQKPVNQSLEFMIDYMEYGLIFNQIFREASQKEKVEVVYPKVIEDFKRFVREKPKSRLAAEAKVRIAELYNLTSPQSKNSLEGSLDQKIEYNKNWLVEANKWLADVVQNHTQDKRFDYVHGKEINESVAAQALYYLGHWNRNFTYLSELLNKHPESEPAKLVSRKLTQVGEKIEETEFYQKLIKEIEIGRQELARIELKHSPKKIKCTEIRRQSDGKEYKYSYDDFAWKEIALKVFNIETRRALIIKVRKEGQSVRSLQPEFIVEIEKRLSGIIWNGRNTAYKIRGVNGSRWAVILNRFPARLKNGKRKDAIYAPHSTALQREFIINQGDKFLTEQITGSFLELDRLAAKNDSKPSIMEEAGGHLISSAIERLAVNEHTDYFEFKEFKAGRWPYSPFSRVFVILALNGREAFSSTPSPARAMGLMQATNHSRGRRVGTWDLIRKKYSWAVLPSFKNGASDYKQAIKFALLLQDYNLRLLIKELGGEIINDPNLEHYLAAAYNGGVKHVIEAIKNSRRNETDWRRELRKLKKTNENIEYLEKLDYLLEMSKSKGQ